MQPVQIAFAPTLLLRSQPEIFRATPNRARLFRPAALLSVIPRRNSVVLTFTRYTETMDSVRFGRTLGIGARHAAKTLVTAVDAATSPNPSGTAPRTPPSPIAAQPFPQSASRSAPKSVESPTQVPTQTPAQRAGQTAARTASGVRSTTRGIARGSRRFGEAVWGPVVKLSGVLWLELTGVFFGLFALFAAIAAWKLRIHLHRSPTNADAHTHLQLAIAMAILFGYFCVSSFLRASRRGRRP